jgi:uncharacterized protein
LSPVHEGGTRPRFITDRMLGPLCRYLRLLGYDTLDTNRLQPGNPREDSEIIRIASTESRVILTRDRELARRGSDTAVLLSGNDVLDQVRDLVRLGLITPRLVLDRCPLCNSLLRPATPEEVQGTSYAPAVAPVSGYHWCPDCSHLYWEGGHCTLIRERLNQRIHRG